MKQTVVFMLILLALGGLVACRSEPIPKEESKVVEKSAKSDKVEQAQENEAVVMIKEKMKLGLTKTEIESLLSHDYQKVKAANDDSEMWRYDLELKKVIHHLIMNMTQGILKVYKAAKFKRSYLSAGIQKIMYVTTLSFILIAMTERYIIIV